MSNAEIETPASKPSTIYFFILPLIQKSLLQNEQILLSFNIIIMQDTLIRSLIKKLQSVQGGERHNRSENFISKFPSHNSKNENRKPRSSPSHSLKHFLTSCWDRSCPVSPCRSPSRRWSLLFTLFRHLCFDFLNFVSNFLCFPFQIRHMFTKTNPGRFVLLLIELVKIDFVGLNQIN
jgi:hypothetical protein